VLIVRKKGGADKKNFNEMVRREEKVFFPIASVRGHCDAGEEKQQKGGRIDVRGLAPGSAPLQVRCAVLKKGRGEPGEREDPQTFTRLADINPPEIDVDDGSGKKSGRREVFPRLGKKKKPRGTTGVHAGKAEKKRDAFKHGPLNTDRQKTKKGVE